MKSALLVIPFLLVGLVPVAFGQVVETNGQNYDLIEDFTIGEAKWTSHPERIMVNGEWENYFLQVNDQQIIFRSNSVGGFIYDIPSCSYSIYENGFDGNQIIPSVSSVASYNVNGNWQNMAVNQEECLVDYSQGTNGIFITSTKTLFGETNQPIFQSYNGTGSTVNVNGTNYNVISNGNQTGYYVDNFVPVETEKYVQELKVDIFGGIKETFKVWNESDEPLGISQTVHTGDFITVGNNELNISQYNGQSFDKQFLEDNKAQVFEIAESLNYDFKDGFDSLTGINIISESGFFSSTNKVNLDYASGEFVNYLEIDPTFSSSTSTLHGARDSSFNGNCSDSKTSYSISTQLIAQRYTGTYDCDMFAVQWDISSIPDSAVITDTDFDFHIYSVSGTASCDITPMTVDITTGTDTQIFDDIQDGTPYIDGDTSQCSSTGTNKTFDLGTSADNDLQSNLTSDFFGIGFKLDNVLTTGMIRAYGSGSGTPDPTLTVTYDIATYPQPPTNLQTVTGIPIEVSWTAPVDDGGSSITGYKVYRTLNQYVMTELPNNGGTTGVDFTDNELLLHDVSSTQGINSNLDATAHETITWSTDVPSVGGSNSMQLSAPYNGAIQGISTYMVDGGASVGNDGFTIGAWAKRAGSQGDGNIVGASTYDGSNGGNPSINSNSRHTLYYWTSNALRAYTQDSSGGTNTLGSSFADNTWVQVLLVRESASGPVKSYINGALNTNYSAGSSYNTPNMFYVGGLGGYLTEGGWIGKIDEAFFLDRPVTSAEITALQTQSVEDVLNGDPDLLVYYDFEQTSGNPINRAIAINKSLTDSSPNTLTVTSTNLAETTSKVIGTNAISAPNLEVTSSLLPDATDSFTVGSWVKQTATPTNTKLFGFTNSNGDDVAFNVGTTTADFKVNTTPIISATGLADNTSDYHHYSLTRDSSSWTLYQDGSSVATATDSIDLGTVSGSHKINLDGSIDEYFIDSTALTSNEIETVYGMGSEPSLLTTTGTTTSYDDSGVTGGNTYYYYVKSTNAIGDSDFSAQATGLAGTPPNPPTSVTTSITNVNTNPLEVLIQWSAPTNVGSGTLTGFEIVRDGSVVATVGLVSSYTDTVPSAGTYTYLVRAISTHGTSSDSNTSNITTPNPPSAINNLSATVNSDTQVSLTWSSPSNGGSSITGFIVHQDGVQIATPTSTSYTVTGLTPDTSYTFTVYSVNNVGTSLVSNSETVTTYLSVTGQIDITSTTIQGASAKIEFLANVTSGTPTPTFSNYIIKQGTTTIASGITSPYILKITNPNLLNYTISSTASNHWNTPTISGSTSIQPDYTPNWENGVSYNIVRTTNNLDLFVNRDLQTNWNLTCNYVTTAQILADETGVNGTITSDWYFDDSQAIGDTNTVYIECIDDGVTVLSLTEYNTNRIGGGIALLDNIFSEWTGTPVALFFVLLVAGLFSGRSAPAGILLVLAIVGVLGFIGLLVIDELIWAFILLAGILGIFMGKRFL